MDEGDKPQRPFRFLGWLLGVLCWGGAFYLLVYGVLKLIQVVVERG